MFEKISLPANAESLGRPLFPFAHNRLHSLFAFRKRYQQMQVIWHQDRECNEPGTHFISVNDRIENAVCHFGTGKLIFSTRLATNGNEIRFLCRIDP